MIGSAINPGRYDREPLPDEPTFRLLARDQSAPLTIYDWVKHRRAALVTELADVAITQERKADLQQELRQCSEAEQIADSMHEWRQLNEGKWRPVEGDGRARYGDGSR